MDPEYASFDKDGYYNDYKYEDMGVPRSARIAPPRSIRVQDSTGRTLRVGDHVRGQYQGVPYTGTVTVIGSPYPNRSYREIKVERNDDGKTQDSFSDSVTVIGNNL